MEITKDYTFTFHTFEKYYANDFLNEVAEVFQRNAVITNDFFFSKVFICGNNEDSITISATFDTLDIVFGEKMLTVNLSASFSLDNFFEKEKRFNVWGKNIADIFSDVSFQKSSVFFSDYSWLK